jgi:hypothetical protein
MRSGLFSALRGLNIADRKPQKENIHLECSPLWGPIPLWHLECIEKE